jgi:hypothetical protein
MSYYGNQQDPYPPGGFRPPDIGDDPAMRLIMPVGTSIWAIIAGYLGLFAVLCLPAPLALIMGIVAVWDIRRNPRRHGMGRAIFGIVMGAIFSVPLLFFLIATIAQALRGEG